MPEIDKEIGERVETPEKNTGEKNNFLPKDIFKNSFEEKKEEISGEKLSNNESKLPRIFENKNLEESKNSLNEKIKNCPIENGEWVGERGNSVWKPKEDYIPLKANKENKNWKTILDKHKIEGIKFKDGDPDFSEISKGNVEIQRFSENRDDNFNRADLELAKQKECSPQEVKKWRKENGYTWHECRDMKTMQKVPSIVHNNVSHSGGISEYKKGVQEYGR